MGPWVFSRLLEAMGHPRKGQTWATRPRSQLLNPRTEDASCAANTHKRTHREARALDERSRARESTRIAELKAKDEEDDMEELSSVKVFGGYNRRFRHFSKACGCVMTFHVYFPPQSDTKAVPIVYYLSGLTCTDENVIVKSGVQRQAAEMGIAIIAPDTSPRGLNIEGESESWDFGVGAGFYVNATNPKWKNWRMYDYVTEELPALLEQQFGGLKLDVSNAAIMGHSMGGHGALTIAMKNPGKYKSVSAFAPVSHPTKCPWGEKAFSNYLGEDREAWKEYDATELALNYRGPPFPILIDQGSCDTFYDTQLRVHDLAHALFLKKFPCTIRMQPGYDHSYFFIASFMEDHMAVHARALLQ